ncbi:MAG: beta-glucosidase [Rhodoluna sp.]|nr:beta-glucosidase [Rhodoluna sp.]
MSFPEDFNWGSATASYQVEGAFDVGGRSASIWDTFSKTPGKVVRGDNGDVACDHYNRFLEDVQIMKDLGMQTYRFSIAWPRIIPNGTGEVNQEGIDFYNRLIDALLEAGIQPTATLYHWDLPQVLQDKGGWANRDIVQQFADYATVCAEAFGDRVSNWITINEPWCVTWLGNFWGVHAPGLKDLDTSIAVAHHTALAHAEATRALRAARPEIRSGITLNMTNYRVSDESNPELLQLRDYWDSNINRWWIDAQLHGTYPANLVEFYGEKLAKVVLPGDMEKLKIDSEFLGVNYYSDSFLNTPTQEQVEKNEGTFVFPINSDGTSPAPHTDMGWPITPEGLGDLLIRIHDSWPEITDIAITENGVAYDDEPDENGVVNDQRRVDYLLSHLHSVASAIDAGSPVKSYYYWSLMDNFEWAEGYAKRFGIVHINFETLQRTPKLSAKVYSSVIASNGALLDTVAKN